jgi:hypothetical protein
MADNNLHSDLGFVPDDSGQDHTDLGFVPDEQPKSMLDKATDFGEKYLLPFVKLGLDISTGDAFGTSRMIRGESPENAAQAVQHGAFQGVTLGFGDELLGATKGAGEALATGKPLEDAYVDARDSIRQQDAQARAEHPYLYGAGEIAGGAALPFGVTGKVAQATSKLPFLTRLVTRMAAGAGEGYALGGTSAAGHSEASTPEELATDIHSGGKTGALWGGGLAGALTTAGGIKNVIAEKANKHADNIEAVGKIVKPYQKGKEGELLTLNEQKKKLGDAAESFGYELSDTAKDLKTRYDRLLQDFEDSGGTIDLKDRVMELEAEARELLNITKDPDVINEINRVRERIKNYIKLPSVKTVTETIPVQEMDTSGGLLPPPVSYQTRSRDVLVPGETELTGRQAKELESNLRDLAFGDNKVTTATGQKFAGQAKQGIGDEVAAIPLLKDTNARYHRLNQALREIGLDANELKPEDFGKGKELATKVFDKIRKLIETSGKESSTELTASMKLDHIFKALNDVDPRLTQQFKYRLQDVAENYELAKELHGPIFGGGMFQTLGTVMSGGGIKGRGKIANAVGLAVGKGNFENITRFAKGATNSAIMQDAKPEQLSQEVYKLNDNDLNTLASELMVEPTLQADATALQKALSTNNSVGKNAALFNLLQKQEGRNALRGMVK